jgi:methyltransferase (TIGR00027 family)
VIEGKPSGTSWRVAVRRATHQIVDKPPVFDDPLALVIIGPEARAQIEANPHAGDSPGWTALRAYLAVRSRVAEDALAAAVRAGVRQYVVLGAGLDTFAYRNTDRTLRVFEVDHPETQAWKRKLLTKFQIAVPDDVTYVPVNFERQDLGEELARTGLDATRPTFFSWLGVTMYLTRDSIRGTLRILRRLAGGTGGIAFDYAQPPHWYRPIEWLGYRVMARRVAAAGEPFRSLFEPKELAALLRDVGFSTFTDLGADGLNEKYFAGRADRLKIRGRGHVVVATGR